MVADVGGQTGAEGKSADVVGRRFIEKSLCNDGCPSLRRLGPARLPRAAIVTPGCGGAQGKDSGLKRQDEGERSMQTHQYLSEDIPRG